MPLHILSPTFTKIQLLQTHWRIENRYSHRYTLLIAPLHCLECATSRCPIHSTTIPEIIYEKERNLEGESDCVECRNCRSRQCEHAVRLYVRERVKITSEKYNEKTGQIVGGHRYDFLRNENSLIFQTVSPICLSASTPTNVALLTEEKEHILKIYRKDSLFVE